MRVLESIFASDYHALQMSAERRGARFSGKAYYTYGKAEEDLDYQGGGLPAVQNSNRIDLERGRTSADRRTVFTFSGIFIIDYFRDSTPVVKALLNDWTVSAIVTLQSGTPLTIGAGVDRNFDGLTNDRADINGDPELDGGRPRDGADRAVVRHYRLFVAGHRQRRQLERSIVDGPGYPERRPRRVQRHETGGSDAAAVPRSKRPTSSTSSTCRTRGST